MKKTAFLVLLLFVCKIGYTQNAFIPEPTLKVVSDFEKLLTEEEIEGLAKDIKDEYNSNSNQVMIVTIPTSYLGNLQIEDYAQQLFDKWQPGQKGLNNGVLVIIAGSKIDSIGRKLRIHTGYGIEGALPDILCGRIQAEMMVPELKKGNYYKAIKNGVASILSFISNENIGKAPQYKIEVQKSGDLVFDYARIFTDDEKKKLEEKMHAMFNSNNYVILTELENSYVTNYVAISKRYAYSSDTALIRIACNPGYFTDDRDSILKFDNDHKSYYLTFNTNYATFDFDNYDNVYKEQLALEAAIGKLGIYQVCVRLIEKEKIAYLKQLQSFFWFFSYLFSASLFVFMAYLFTKKYKKQPQLKKPILIKIVLGIILMVIIFYSFLSLCTLEILYYATYNNYIHLSMWIWILLLVALGVSHIFNIAFIYKIDANYFNYKLFSWIGKGGGGGSDGYTNSSSSSYSSSSSSSSSNSSSNGGYYGGGGKSGGGGASSDW